MKKYTLHIIAVTALLCSFSGSLYSQSTIRGSVKSGIVGTPMPGITITVKGTTTGTITNASGNYFVGVSSGVPVTLVATSVGFSPIERTLTPDPGDNWMNFWFDPPDLPSDFDGNYYKTVVIGTQRWMKENLTVTHFRDGTNIPNVTNNTSWTGLSASGYCWYNNDFATYKDTYGALYNWYIVRTNKLCPTGWHVPADDEWGFLFSYLQGGGNVGGKLKETGTTHWNSPNTGATDESGFTGLPGGFRTLDGNFNNIAIRGEWWSTSENYFADVDTWMVNYDDNYIATASYAKQFGYSVRCVMDTIPGPSTLVANSISQNSAKCGGNVIFDGGDSVTVKGICWSKSINPTTSDPHTNDGNGTGSFTSILTGLASNSTYYVRAYATNIKGTAYGNEISFTTYKSDAINDADGNYYNVVTIGSQTWMAENLRTTKFNNNINVPFVPDSITWANLVSPGYCWYANDSLTYRNEYGALYNWFAVDSLNLCPTDWHVPTDLEWTTLVNFLGSNAGGKLKETGSVHWAEPNQEATNESGFTALPGGTRTNLGLFELAGTQAYWWSSSAYVNPNFHSYSLFRYLLNSDGISHRMFAPNTTGFSVRCLKDISNPTLVINTKDSGNGSLRSALDYSNATAGVKDTIRFNIPGTGPFTIQPLSSLPSLTDPVVIDGFTQPGASVNGSVLEIAIDGSKAGAGSNGLTVSASNCTIKGLIISQFSGNGIQILSGSGNLISSSSIYSNDALGINLGSDVVTLNDANDADNGPNNLQNFPVLDSVKFDLGAKTVFIHGYLQSVANSAYTLQFFTNKIGDNTGYGEGQTYLGSAQANTNSNGKAVFGQTFTISSSWGDVISATATDTQGNTSEFSENIGGLQNQIIAGEKWPFYYRTNTDGVLRITDGSDIIAVDSSFRTWTRISTAGIDFRNGGITTTKYASANDGMNLITFTDDQFPFSPGVLAIAAKTLKIVPGTADAQIIDADIVINPVFSRNDVGVGYNNPDAGTYDIQSIVTHEIGHVLGLLHAGIYNSTMFYMLGQGTKVRSLEQDDKSWASYRYPGASYNSTFGSISGNITYGYDNQPVAGALVLAINTSVKDTVHAYSDAYGNYLVPGLRAGQYNIYIEPLDGSSKVYKLKPGNISSYTYCNTIYTDYPGEFYSDQESSIETADTPKSVRVTSGSETQNINLITNKDVTKPRILSVYPPKDTTGIDVASDIIITFSEPVDKTTLTDKTCYLESGGILHGVNYTAIGNSTSIILVALDSALKYSTAYNIHLTNGVTDLRGNPLESAYQSSFTTKSSDIVPPEITGTYPVDKADTVFIMDKVVLFFSEPMDRTSVEKNFTLTWADGVPAVLRKVDGSFTWDRENKSLTFTPLNSLKEGTDYTITESAAATDLSGNNLVTSNSFKFATVPNAAPIIVYLGPVNQEDSVSINTPIVADFSEPIDPSSINSSTFNLTINGVPVTGSFEFMNENSRVIFRPATNLSFGKSYLVTLTTGIKDVSSPSLNMKVKKTGTFITSAQLTVPHISYLEPPAGVIGSDVIIAGTGFDPNPQNNIVRFNTSIAVVTSATLTSLTTKVPLGATSGTVTVAGKNGVLADNSIYFYVIPQSDNPCDVIVANSSVGTKSTKDVAVDANAAFAYITNPLSDQVTVVDLVRSAVVKSITVGKTPMKIDINPSGSLAYVTNFNSNDVSVINLATMSVVRTIKVGIQPYGIAVTPNGKGVYVANYFSENVSLIDVDPYSGGFDHVVANVSTGSRTSNVAVSPDAGMVLVTGDFGLRIIDANPKDANYNCIVATAGSGTRTKDVAVTADASLAVVSTEAGNLLLINLHPDNGDYSDAVVANVSSGTNVSNVRVSGDNMFVYATATEKNELLVYKITQGGTGATNGSTVSGITLVPHNTISVGISPEGLVIDPKAEKIYIIDGAPGSRQVTTIRLCCGPVDPAKAIGDLIMSVQNLVKGGFIKGSNGNEIIDKLNAALLDLQKGKTKNAVNDLNTFINKVQSQINGHKITAAQGQPLINAANVIVTQLNGTKSALAAPYLTSNDQTKQKLPTESGLGIIYPNPFSESITINYAIAEYKEGLSKVQIKVYDIDGRSVITLVDNKMMEMGFYSVSWGGTFDNGGKVPYGSYFVLFKAGGVEEVRKLILIKPR